MKITTNTIQHVEPQSENDFSHAAHIVTVITFMIALEKASHYEDWDPQEWQERARDLGVTREDMIAFRESEARIALGRPLPF